MDKDNYLVLNCNTKNMPVWKNGTDLLGGEVITREKAFNLLDIELCEK